MIILRLINGQIWPYQYLHFTRTIAQHLVENGKTTKKIWWKTAKQQKKFGGKRQNLYFCSKFIES